MSHPILTDMARSKGDPRDMTGVQLNALRLHFNNSLFDFAWTFFNFRDLEGSGFRPVHKELCDLLQLWGTPVTEASPEWHPGDRLMVQIPRGAYKSSLCTIANGLWQVSRNPNQTVLIANEIMDNAKKWLRLIREVISTNRLYQTVYRDVLPPGIHWEDKENGIGMPRGWKWSDQEFNLARDSLVPECSLTAAGVGTATTGGHWDRLIKDDLVSEDAKQSPTLMQRARDWFDSSLPLEKPPYHGKDLVVCTPWSYDDVYRYILEKYGYKLYRRQAIEVDDAGRERTLVPKTPDGKGWALEELREMQRKRPFYFSSQMMCAPKAGEEQSFQPQWLRYFDLKEFASEVHIPAEYYNAECTSLRTESGEASPAPDTVRVDWMSRILLVDPASADDKTVTRHGQARTGILVVGMDPWGRRFLLDGWAGKANPAEVINQMFTLAMRWNVNRVGIEEVTFSVVYQHWLRQESARRGYHLTPIPLKPAGRRKEDRILSLLPGFQRGLFYLRREGASVIELFRREYLDYPYAATKDLLDALAYEADVLWRPDLPATARHLRDLDDEFFLKRRDITGYGPAYF